jgi:hypothetical protein
LAVVGALGASSLLYDTAAFAEPAEEAAVDQAVEARRKKRFWRRTKPDWSS